MRTLGTQVSIPSLGVGMSEGTLSQWLVANGDHVEPGTPLYVLETEKVENEVAAIAAGTITLLAEAGENYPVGTVIAEIS